MTVQADNKQQAELKAKAALYKVNSLQQEGTVEISGNILATAGNNCELAGLGVFSGLYYINRSTHSISKDGGYATSLEIKRVGLIEKKKQKADSSDGRDPTYTTPSRESIWNELDTIIKKTNIIIKASNQRESVEEAFNSVAEELSQAISSISDKGYNEEYDALSNIQDQLQSAISEENKAQAVKIAQVEGQLARQISLQQTAKINAAKTNTK